MPDNFSSQDREWEDWAEQFDMSSDINGWNSSGNSSSIIIYF